MVSLLVHAVLGVTSTALVLRANRHLFAGRGPSPLEVVLWVVGAASVALGWYCNVRYVQQFGTKASWVHFTQSLFSNWAADSAAQDYIIANVVLLPLWTTLDGRRRGIRAPWGFFVISLFTSYAFAVAAYLAVVERATRSQTAPA